MHRRGIKVCRQSAGFFIGCALSRYVPPYTLNNVSRCRSPQCHQKGINWVRRSSQGGSLLVGSGAIWGKGFVSRTLSPTHCLTQHFRSASK